MSKLSKRLENIYNLVSAKVVADVGCDHGKLAKKLLDNNKVDYVYISDISASSLSKAENLLKDYTQVKSICCDGLQGFQGECVQECIISGMGGDEIIKIISNSPIDIETYILSPQHNNVKLKKFLIKNNYNIVYDIIIEDKSKFYNILKCVKSNKVKHLSEFDLVLGKDNFNNNPDFEKFLITEYNKTQNIIDRNNELMDKKEYLEIIKRAIELKGIKL